MGLSLYNLFDLLMIDRLLCQKTFPCAEPMGRGLGVRSPNAVGPPSARQRKGHLQYYSMAFCRRADGGPRCFLGIGKIKQVGD